MANALIIFKQTLIMFGYMAAGYLLFRARLITREGSASMANLLLYLLLALVLPGLTAAMKTALFIAAMAPVGSNVAVYAQKQGKDYSYAVGLVCLSTVFSVLTMPLLILLAGNF